MQIRATQILVTTDRSHCVKGPAVLPELASSARRANEMRAIL